jgi:hypothetical protein
MHRIKAAPLKFLFFECRGLYVLRYLKPVTRVQRGRGIFIQGRYTPRLSAEYTLSSHLNLAYKPGQIRLRIRRAQR